MLLEPLQQHPAAGEGVVYASPVPLAFRNVLDKFGFAFSNIMHDACQICRLSQPRRFQAAAGILGSLAAVLCYSLYGGGAILVGAYVGDVVDMDPPLLE